MKRTLIALLLLVPAFAAGQMLDPALLTKPLGDSWPMYSGDYSGKRYSSLKQINQTNVKNLTLGWASRVTPGAGNSGGGRGGAAQGTTIIGGEGAGTLGTGGF